MVRKLMVSVLATVLLLGMVVGAPAVGQEAGSGEVTIIHDSHFHGKFGDEEDGTPGLANIARWFTLVEQLKAAHGDSSIYLMNGDDIAPSVFSGVFEPHGIHMIDALNEVAHLIDAATLGNHEFDFGPENLELLLAEATFPYVTANVRDANDLDEVFGAALGVTEFLILDVDGVQVGVTGLGPEGMDTITRLGDSAVQIPAADALDIVVPKMQDAGADIIVVTSHLCGTDAIALA
jgi:2',3'-cyclic-nucleotide 2'-phosphodiesterase (5'-nucleotidase family)